MDHGALIVENAERAGHGFGSISSAETDWLSFGLRLKPELRLPFGEWGTQGIDLGQEEASGPWRRGDWYLRGKQQFPHGFLTALLTSREWEKAGGCKHKTAVNNGRTCRKFPPTSRHRDVSYEHHAVVARLPDAIAHAMLNKAAELGWSENRLEIEVKRHLNGYHARSSGDIVSSLEGLIARGEKYHSICVDPPWDSLHRSGALTHYRTMTHESICAVRVPEISTSATTLYLWCTEYIRDQGIAVMNAWGFHNANTPFIWHKTGGCPGTGYRTRVVHEVLLVGLRGESPKKWSVGYPSIIEHPRSRHSEKPDIFYRIIREVTGGKCLEMFGRKRRDGWDVVGDQVE